MSTPITLGQLNEALDQLVAERGNETNPGAGTECYYTNPDGTPACIIGHILPLLGLGDLRPDAGEDNNTLVDVYTLIPGGALEEEAILLASFVQESADDGHTWRRSVESARNHSLWTTVAGSPAPYRRQT